MMKMVKKWWFYAIMPIVLICALVVIGPKKELKNYEDYIFYGVAQNSVSQSKVSDFLKVNYTIKGWPALRHSVYVEVIDHHGVVDFLYSEEHTANHRAHLCKDGCLRKYKAYYKIPKSLVPGKYRLRVTFEFDTPGWGRLNRDKYISNEVKFEIKE